MSAVSLPPPVAAAGVEAYAPDLPAPTMPPTTSSTEAEDFQSRAKEFIDQDKFNRRFTLPATDAHGELTVTYAVAGTESESAPTALFIGGMFGGRFLATIADHLASKLGMRLIVTDRPGMGGSTPVSPSLRLSVWLETVPALMRSLNVQHLSLAAHSCGGIYALNTLYAMPWILPPSNRTLYLFSPWVSAENSGMTLWSVSSYLPSPLINSFDSVIKFVNTKIMPTVRFSGMLSGVVAAPFSEACGSDQDDEARPRKRHEREDLCFEYNGITLAEMSARSDVVTRAVFSESTQGASHEALLSLRKEVAGSWGACDSYEAYPDLLDAKLREYLQDRNGDGPESRQPTGPQSQQNFVVKTFWAETDMMIGKQGEKYFDKCFQRFAQSDNLGGDEACLRYESEVVSETNHETLCLPEYEALGRALEEMIGRHA